MTITGMKKEIDGVLVIYDYPPVWDSVVGAFNIRPLNAVFTYGDKIYNPGGAYLPDHVMVHEKVHIKQQGGTDEGAALWWGKFLRDSIFRIEQEIEAYAVQYKFVCGKVKDRNARFNFLLQLARTMSGPMYGKCITTNEATKLIRDQANVQN